MSPEEEQAALSKSYDEHLEAMAAAIDARNTVDQELFELENRRNEAHLVYGKAKKAFDRFIREEVDQKCSTVMSMEYYFGKGKHV